MTVADAMATQPTVEIVSALSADQILAAKRLFEEYAASLGFSLCFQNFDQELANLPGDYAPPRGALLLALIDGQPVGCVALRPWSDTSAEMKRLYVLPAARGLGIGRRLATAILDEAKQRGYTSVRLDTINGKMDPAIALYRSFGFVEIPAYAYHPVPGSLCLELRVQG